MDAVGTKLSSTSGMLRLLVHGANPLLPVGPAIDLKLNITFQYLPATGEIQYKLKGVHDGFPAYELYINRQSVYVFDPRIAGTTPNALFPPEDRTVNTVFKTIARCPLTTTAAPTTRKPTTTKPPTTRPTTIKPPPTIPPPTTKPPTTRATTTISPTLPYCNDVSFTGDLGSTNSHVVPFTNNAQPLGKPCLRRIIIPFQADVNSASGFQRTDVIIAGSELSVFSLSNGADAFFYICGPGQITLKNYDYNFELITPTFPTNLKYKVKASPSCMSTAQMRAEDPNYIANCNRGASNCCGSVTI